MGKLLARSRRRVLSSNGDTTDDEQQRRMKLADELDEVLYAEMHRCKLATPRTSLIGSFDQLSISRTHTTASRPEQHERTRD